MYLATVADYLTECRVLLQDQVVPYRYSDSELVANLNMGILESRLYRPDFFPSSSVSPPTYSAGSPTTAVAIDAQYRVAFLYYMVGHAQLRDDEGTQDQRAGAFLQRFRAMMGSTT